MNKMNNKGFLLAESLIVATFVLTVLIYLFSQFKNLMIEYKKNYQYNTVENIYNLGSVSKYINQNKIVLNDNQYLYKDNDCTNEIPNEKKTSFKNLATSMNIDYLIFTDSDIEKVKNNMSSYDQDMQDFIEKISTKKIEGKGRLLAKFKNGNFATIITEKKLRALIKTFTDYSKNTIMGNSEIEKTNVTGITFEDSINVPNGAISWDVSDNGAVMAWVTPDPSDSSKYILHVGGDGGVTANGNSNYIFCNFTNLKYINFGNNFDTSGVTKMEQMFSGCSNLTSLDLSNFDTSKVTTMYQMFNGCSNLTNITFGEGWSHSTATTNNMDSMFSGCSSLTSLDLSYLDTKNVTSMSSMFHSCNNLTNLDLSNFDTSNVTNMGSLFYKCSNLTNLDLSNFDTSKVKTMNQMFSKCSNLTNITFGVGWSHSTAATNNMGNMFSNCTNLTSLDLSYLDTSNVTSMSSMFNTCNMLQTIFVSNRFDTNKVTASTNMFYKANNIVGGNGTAVATKKVYDKTYALIDKPGQEGYFTQK